LSTCKKAPTKLNTIEELALMRMSIRTMRDHINQNLDAMLDQINRLIPPEDTKRRLRYKNFTKKDWTKFLGF
jgi:hypothetical protein